MILLSGDYSWLENVYLVVVITVIAVGVVMFFVKKSAYMKQQKENGTDKKKVMDAMQKQMGNRFPDYTYVVGFYTKTENYGRGYKYYHYPYILAFSNTELIIFSFLMRDGELIVRNRLDINWDETELNSAENSKGTKMHLYLSGEMMIINVNKVIESNGIERSDKPLGIYQEQEVERFISLLPQFKSYAKKNKSSK